MPQAVQEIGGRLYVYEYKSIWNKQKQRSEQKRVYIGRIINDVFVPNEKYLLTQELHKAERATFSGQRLFAGATYLLDQISDSLGLEADLKYCFPHIYQEILSLSYYLALEPASPLYRFKRWAACHQHPGHKEISSQRSSELLGMITEAAKTEFLHRQARRRVENEYWFYDCTSISSYSQQLKQVKYGKNKEGDCLAQINLALLLGGVSGLPAYYRKLPGNITDVMTIQSLLKGIDGLNPGNIRVVMDRGFYSAQNTDDLYNSQHSFIMGAKISLKYIQAVLDSQRATFEQFENYDAESALFIKRRRIDWPPAGIKSACPEKRSLFIHFYYNSQLAADEKTRFLKTLDIWQNELSLGKRRKEHEKSYAKYFYLQGTTIKAKQAVIDQATKNDGFFVLLTNEEIDSTEALKIYRSKDLIEKSFSDLKERLNMRRACVSSEENLEGKLFIQYIGLIYLSYIKRAMDKAGLFKHYTMQELFDELDVIELYKPSNTAAYYGEITDKQKKIFSALGVKAPS